MDFLSAVVMLIKIMWEAWPYIKDAITEDPDEFAASLNEVVRALGQIPRNLSREERRAKYRDAARGFADHIKRV